MRLQHSPFFVAVLIFFATACTTEIETLPPFASDEIINAVIEIPAGTNRKIEYSYKSGEFETNRMVHFLPYPLNYGFIPGTLMDTKKGGDGDPLDIIVISERIKTGTRLKVIPIAMLRMKDKGQLDNKILAIPSDTSLQTLKVKNFEELSDKYPAILKILNLWFDNYDPADKKEMMGWGSEKDAIADIRKWEKK